MTPLPTVPPGTPADCWNHIGVRGDRSCPHLPPVVHCQNCSVFSAAGRRFLNAPSPSGYRDEWTVRLAQPIEAEASDWIGVLVFQIAGEWLALPLAVLVEATAPKPVHRVPHRAGILAGLVNIRGELTLAAHIRILLGLEAAARVPTGHERMLVFRHAGERWVFAVDAIARVYRLPQSEIVAAPATVGRAANHLTRGAFAWDGHAVGLIDPDRLIDALRGRLR